MPLSDFVVVEIMRGRNFDATAAERRVDVGVPDDGNVSARERQVHPAADQMPIALILGMNRDSRIAEHGFRSRGRDDEMTAAVAQWVLEVPQTAGLLLGDHF